MTLAWAKGTLGHFVCQCVSTFVYCMQDHLSRLRCAKFTAARLHSNDAVLKLKCKLAKFETPGNFQHESLRIVTIHATHTCVPQCLHYITVSGQ